MAAAALFLLGCGDDQAHDDAVALYGRVAEHATWQTARDYPKRMPSFTAHADAVEIRVNPVMAALLQGPNPIERWPAGSIVVKDGFTSGGKRALTAIMEKREDGWFFAEYDANGDPTYSGHPKVCTSCHDNRDKYSDWLYGVDLPR